MSNSKSPLPSFKEWKNQNLDSLIDEFTKKYGNKIDEMADFFEHQYDLAKAEHVAAQELESPSP